MKAVCNNDFVNALYSHEIKLFIDKYLRLKCFATYWFFECNSLYFKATIFNKNIPYIIKYT